VPGFFKNKDIGTKTRGLTVEAFCAFEDVRTKNHTMTELRDRQTETKSDRGQTAEDRGQKG